MPQKAAQDQGGKSMDLYGDAEYHVTVTKREYRRLDVACITYNEAGEPKLLAFKEAAPFDNLWDTVIYATAAIVRDLREQLEGS
jgi:hypothetical protein